MPRSSVLGGMFRALLCVGILILEYKVYGQLSQEEVNYEDLQTLLEYGEDIRQGGEEDEVKVTNLKSVDEIHSLDSLDKVEEIIPIDDDLAEKMRAQIEGNSALDLNALVSKTVGSSSDSLSRKVQRLYNLFGINDIDDIIKVIPIRSMKKVSSNNGLNLNYENGYESEYETNSLLSNTDLYEESISNYRNPNSRLESYERNNQGRVYSTDPARLYLDHRTDVKNPRIIETNGGQQQQRLVDSLNTRGKKSKHNFVKNLSNYFFYFNVFKGTVHRCYMGGPRYQLRNTV